MANDDGHFQRMVAELHAFVEREGRLPMYDIAIIGDPRSTSGDIVQVSDQTTCICSLSLRKSHIAYRMLYLLHHVHLQIVGRTVGRSTQLGDWINARRHEYRMGRLDQSRIERLGNLDSVTPEV
jgi:hypothetical protein